MNNLHKYLIGNDNNRKSNDIGAVLAFTTKISVENVDTKPIAPFKTYERLSVLMFLDFRTGRIERYLINVSNLGLINIPLTTDFKEDVYFTHQGEKYRIFHDNEHLYNPDHTESSLFNLGDGILSKDFYRIFITELFRDYLIYWTSYNDGNMASLRKISIPVEHMVNEDGNKQMSSGTGRTTDIEMSAVEASPHYRVKDFEQYQADKYLDYGLRGAENKYNIFIPKNFEDKAMSALFNAGAFNLIPSTRGDLPQVCTDFVRTFNIKKVNNIHSTSLKIRTWNYEITKRLKRMKKEINPKDR